MQFVQKGMQLLSPGLLPLVGGSGLEPLQMRECTRLPPAEPDTHPLARLKSAVLHGLASPHSQSAYNRSLTEFLRWYQADARGDGFTKATVQQWVDTLRQQGRAPSTINARLSAVRKLAIEAADNGALPEAVAQSIRRVKGQKQSGVRRGNWLMLAQAEALLKAPDPNTLRGKPDRALLALLLGCGLRRAELASLQFADIGQRDGRWAIVDLRGKGGRIRTVPMPSWAKQAVDLWAAAIGRSTGLIFWAVNNKRQLTATRCCRRTSWRRSPSMAAPSG
jgi:site-specific recombinase XerD